MGNLKNELQVLRKELSRIIDRVDDLLTDIGGSPAGTERSGGRTDFSTVGGRSSARGKASDADLVVTIIKRHKNGIDVGRLKKKTGFDDKKISNIVHRASKKGRIRRIARGVYAASEKNPQ